VSTTYYVVSWTDHQRRHRGRRPTTREYGTSTLQAAIRLAEHLLPPESEYVITTLSRTVHHGRTPPRDIDLNRAGEL
jgi:hypothetical protein